MSENRVMFRETSDDTPLPSSGLLARVSWYVEHRLGESFGLEDAAAFAGVSRFHLARAFAQGAGRPLMRHARARRLTEAARALAAGAPDILAVALEAGYGSHEAFTRAFRDQFGVTPDQVRARRSTHHLDLVEPLAMSALSGPAINPPRIETRSAFLAAGVGARYACAGAAAIPAQWGRFAPHIGAVPGQVGAESYGICRDFDEAGGFEYVCAVQVRDFDSLPADFSRIRMPSARYAVFSHPGHVSALPATVAAIWNDALPASGERPADAPNFELYGPDFDPLTGQGGVEIWIPLQSGQG
jgi:AraC family transcriptional regulator